VRPPGAPTTTGSRGKGVVVLARSKANKCLGIRSDSMRGTGLNDGSEPVRFLEGEPPFAHACHRGVSYGWQATRRVVSTVARSAKLDRRTPSHSLRSRFARATGGKPVSRPPHRASDISEGWCGLRVFSISARLNSARAIRICAVRRPKRHTRRESSDSDGRRIAPATVWPSGEDSSISSKARTTEPGITQGSRRTSACVLLIITVDVALTRRMCGPGEWSSQSPSRTNTVPSSSKSI
jgi:hypothetical protein